MSSAGIMEPDQVRSKMKRAKEVIDESLRIPGREHRDGDPEIPSGARRVRKLAHEAGWDVEVIYARGITQTPKLIHMIALRMRRDHQRVTALWEADARVEKLTWRLGYAGMLGAFITGKENRVNAFPFTLSNDEMKGVLEGEPMTRMLVTNAQYESIENEDKATRFIPESEFRAPYARKKKEKGG